MFGLTSQAPLAPREVFIRRLIGSVLLAFGVIVVSLGIGMTGYHWLAGLGWVDAFLNASMILGGMGPVDPVRSVGGKLFASFYALFSGLVFLAAAGVVFAPAFHLFLHRFHLGLEDEGAGADPDEP